jgi:hypothetical protein
VTVTSRLRKNAVPYDLAPPRTGRRGRPRLKGARLGTPADLAANADWRKVTVTRYDRHEQAWVAQRRCLWYGAFGGQQVRIVLVREVGRKHEHGGYDLALVTTDLDSVMVAIVARYAARWSIEVAVFDAKQPAGVGQARNRGSQGGRADGAVRVLLPQSGDPLVRPGRSQAPRWSPERRRRAPWCTSKKNPSVADMLAALRRVLIAAEFRPQHPDQPTGEETTAARLAWAQAAA